MEKRCNQVRVTLIVHSHTDHAWPMGKKPNLLCFNSNGFVKSQTLAPTRRYRSITFHVGKQQFAVFPRYQDWKGVYEKFSVIYRVNDGRLMQPQLLKTNGAALGIASFSSGSSHYLAFANHVSKERRFE